MNSGFSLFSQEEWGNEALTITLKPTTYVTKYHYEIQKDGEIEANYTVIGTKKSEIELRESGEYQIHVTYYNGNRTKEETSGIYRIDTEKPVIRLKEVTEGDVLTLPQTKKGATISIEDYIIAIDNYSGNVTSQITSNISEIDTSLLGLHDLKVTVTDQAGNIATKTIHLNLIQSHATSLLGFQITLITIVVLLFGYYMRYRRSIHLERRLARYSVDAIRDRSLSIFGKMSLTLQRWNHHISRFLSKSVFLQKHAKHYEKYVPLYRPFYQEAMDMVATKIMIALSFIIIAIISKTMQSQVMSPYETMIPFLIGYFVPDLLYFARYKLYRNTMENDLLQAIIIMNNAFKSGRSITQAIDLVTRELRGPIGEEFKKMSLELSFGLSIDRVFKRFASRVQLEEITYLTASLTILNKTGGNIIQVFSSIEKTLFQKKKLRLELASLTGSSKLIVYVLFIVPLLFIVFISLISPSYFAPFYTTPIGLCLTGFMIAIYALYVWCVRRIMKVRM